MATTKVAVTVDARLLDEVDRWVAAGEFPNRSRAFHAALEQLRERRRRQGALLAELEKLDSEQERSLAEEWIEGETPWPSY